MQPLVESTSGGDTPFQRESFSCTNQYTADHDEEADYCRCGNLAERYAALRKQKIQGCEHGDEQSHLAQRLRHFGE